ncbi:hypothetical protein RY27_18785 [Litorilinea aerophila]|nr:hypothetical protein RY27_18785 [Litorilinea aerophila]
MLSVCVGSGSPAYFQAHGITGCIVQRHRFPHRFERLYAWCTYLHQEGSFHIGVGRGCGPESENKVRTGTERLGNLDRTEVNLSYGAAN